MGRDKNGLMWFCIMDNEGSPCVSVICCWESKEGILVVNSRKVKCNACQGYLPVASTRPGMQREKESFVNL